VNAVLANCREGANRSGRAYAVMYDLSGLPAGGTKRVMDDKKLLVVIFTGTECPIANAYVPTLNDLAAEYAAKGVGFLAINTSAAAHVDASASSGAPNT